MSAAPYRISRAGTRLPRDVEEAIVDALKEGELVASITKRFGVSKTTIRNVRIRNALPRRVVVNQYGERNSAWKGGKPRRNTQGYIEVYVPVDSEFAVMRTSNGRVLEHRLVVAKELGRPLRSDEYVHHKNGVRDDNRPENLQLASVHRAGKHPVCADCGSHNVHYEDHA